MGLSETIITIGIILVVLGILFRFQPLPLGRLPGDILIKKKNSTFYFPVATLLLLSVIIFAIISIIRRF